MSTLARVFESHGIAAVALVSNRAQAEAISPPRALFCDFPLGRPLGRPADPAFQRRVLDAAFALLGRDDAPILDEFPDVIDDEADQPLACPMPPRHDQTLHPAIDEAMGLRAAHDRTVAATGAPQAGRVVDADGVPAALRPLIDVVEGRPWAEVDFGGDLSTILADIRAYYDAAAVGLAEHVPAARASESWYYQHTEAGRLVQRFRAVVKHADPPLPGVDYLVPLSQAPLVD